jgi:hypothetical protein
MCFIYRTISEQGCFWADLAEYRVGEALLRLPSKLSKTQVSLCSHNLTFIAELSACGTYETVEIGDNVG